MMVGRLKSIRKISHIQLLLPLSNKVFFSLARIQLVSPLTTYRSVLVALNFIQLISKKDSYHLHSQNYEYSIKNSQCEQVTNPSQLIFFTSLI